MAYDVFISYSSKDQAVADAVCAALEAPSHNIRLLDRPQGHRGGDGCGGGDQTGHRAVSGHGPSLFVLRGQVPRRPAEAHLALSSGAALHPAPGGEVAPNALSYYLSNLHWLDALTPPLESHLEGLARKVQLLLTPGGPGPGFGAAQAGPAATGEEPTQRAAARRRSPNRAVLAALGVLEWPWLSGWASATTLPAGRRRTPLRRPHRQPLPAHCYGHSEDTRTASPPSPSHPTAPWPAGAWAMTTPSGSGTRPPGE